MVNGEDKEKNYLKLSLSISTLAILSKERFESNAIGSWLLMLNQGNMVIISHSEVECVALNNQWCPAILLLMPLTSP